VADEWDVNWIGIVNARDGIYLAPTLQSNGAVHVPFNGRVQVIRGHLDPATKARHYFVSTRDGQLGYVPIDKVWTHFPDPTSRLHRVESGTAGTAIAIEVRERFPPSEGDESIHFDWRFRMGSSL
jgi:hypothetical protein